MLKISQKGLAMPESPIRKLVPFAEAAAEKGIDVIQLNIGQPDIETPAHALEKLRSYDEKILAYSHSAGHISYRKALAEYYQGYNLPVTHEDIIVTTGGSEALHIALQCIADIGEEIIIPEPFYANYNGFAAAAGLSVIPVVSSIDDNFALPDIALFEQKITVNTRAIVICNPGNPTGYLYTKEEIQALCDLAVKYHLFLIADEVYREFTYDGAEHHSLLAFHALENTIVIDSTSKRYSMCGARVGCLVTKNKEVYDTALRFAQARLSPPSLGQIVAEEALKTPESYFDEIKAEYTTRRDTLIKGLKDIPGVKVGEPRGAFYCVAQLPVEDAEKFAAWLLLSFEVEGKTVMIAPAQGFYKSDSAGLQQIRIAYVLKQERLEQAIDILTKGIEAYNALM